MGRLVLLVLCLCSAAVAFACVAPSEVREDAPEVLDQEVVRCMSDDDCADVCQPIVELVSQPVTPPAFDKSRCELAAVVAGDPADAQPAPSCLCMEGDSEQSALLISATGPDGCLLYGRDRSCLYDARSFPGCDLSEPETSCEVVCEEVQRRIEVDALRKPEVDVRSASCAETGCHCVVEIEGSCYVDDWLDAYDCSMEDEAILATFERHLRANR